MMLSQLVKKIPILKTIGAASWEEIDIAGVTHDSRRVEKGFLFVAIEGTDQDGHRFIPEAVRKGASAVVAARPDPAPLPVPQLVVDDSRRALAEIAAQFYGHPSLKFRVIGVTGTNGKTTLTYLLESILTAAGRRPAVLGTINYRFAGKNFPAANTTPESADLQKLFSEMWSQGVTDVVMEVSSHALAMERVHEVHFDVGAFTNLSQDHLDFHKNLEDYFQAKLRFFAEYLPASRKKEVFAVLNMEEARSETILENCLVNIVRTGLTGPYEVSCRSFRLSENGIEATVQIGAEKLAIRSPLLGRFNLENILLAMGVAHSLGTPSEAILKGIENLKGVPGRLEKIPNDRGILVFVDYAHTPEALARVGENLRKLVRGRLITVFGCGGDRDRTKRPVMGREAALFSDLVIVTSDNPRTEDPEKIIDEILPGLEEVGYPKDRIFRIGSREEALKKAVALARKGDLILVAGKGHEDYQIVGTKKIPFSDQEVLRKLLGGG
jgi:UDP-N-acetylmuramoyl-L-alanyl-D-glutamate--2,6-diaminopimelate ligase